MTDPFGDMIEEMYKSLSESEIEFEEKQQKRSAFVHEPINDGGTIAETLPVLSAIARDYKEVYGLPEEN